MKLFLLSLVLCSASLAVNAQQADGKELPAGRYETAIAGGKWEKGDIILLDDAHYELSATKEKGEYRHSQSAQRIFFTSGPLKSAFARTVLQQNVPAILLPLGENSGSELKLPGNVTATLKQ